MQIIIVANAGFKYKGSRYYNTEKRVYNGLVRNGHNVWFFSDRDETRTYSKLGIKHLGEKKANENLLSVASAFCPDAILFLNGDKITLETIQAIKKRHPHTRMGQIIVDAIFDPYNIKKIQAKMHLMDAHFLTTAGIALTRFSYRGKPCYFIPNITDQLMDTGRAFDSAVIYDITCPLNHSDDGSEREETARYVKSALPHYRYMYAGFDGVPPVTGHDYIKAFSASALSFNLSRHISRGCKASEDEIYLYSSDRLAHILGNGSLAFIDARFRLDKILSEKEAVFFSDNDDLVDKVRYYLEKEEERKELARNGWQKAHTFFNETIVTKYIMERLFETPLSHEYKWPTEAVRSFA